MEDVCHLGLFNSSSKFHIQSLLQITGLPKLNPSKCYKSRLFFISELETDDKLQYNFFPAGKAGVVFRIKAANDCHVALTSGPEESDPMLEVFIGGWKNSKSVIRKNRTKPDVAESETPGILDGGEFRGFWIRWTDNVITVGKEGEAGNVVQFC